MQLIRAVCAPGMVGQEASTVPQAESVLVPKAWNKLRETLH